MKIVSWNINSVRLRELALARLLRREAPEVVCLQETKVVDTLFPLERFRRLGYRHTALAGQKGYNGVAILSKLPLQNVTVKNWCGRRGLPPHLRDDRFWPRNPQRLRARWRRSAGSSAKPQVRSQASVFPVAGTLVSKPTEADTDRARRRSERGAAQKRRLVSRQAEAGRDAYSDRSRGTRAPGRLGRLPGRGSMFRARDGEDFLVVELSGS